MTTAGDAIPPSAAAPVSRATAWKIVATVLVVAGGLGYLLYASTEDEAAYYMHVDEVVAKPGGWQDKRLKVHGNVADGSIEVARGTLEYRFKIESRPPRAPGIIEAHYTGIVPDTFKSGSEVVAQGYIKDGRLEVVPNGVTAKCPSRYKSDSPENQRPRSASQ